MPNRDMKLHEALEAGSPLGPLVVVPHLLGEPPGSRTHPQPQMKRKAAQLQCFSQPTDPTLSPQGSLGSWPGKACNFFLEMIALNFCSLVWQTILKR